MAVVETLWQLHTLTVINSWRYPGDYTGDNKANKVLPTKRWNLSKPQGDLACWKHSWHLFCWEQLGLADHSSACTTAVNTTSGKVFLVDKLHRLPCESRSQISLTISKYLWFGSLQKEIFRALGGVDRICIVIYHLPEPLLPPLLESTARWWKWMLPPLIRGCDGSLRRFRFMKNLWASPCCLHWCCHA